MDCLKKVRSYLYIIVILCTAKNCLSAVDDNATISLKPVFSFSTSHQLKALGPLQAKLLLPIWTQHSGLGYSALQIQREAIQAWLLGMGVGYRYLLNDQNMLGVHLFFDRVHTAARNTFWLFSPG